MYEFVSIALGIRRIDAAAPVFVTGVASLQFIQWLCKLTLISISDSKVNMSSLGTTKGILEIAKFGVYITVPIVLMYAFANNTDNLRKFMGNRKYIEYPPEAPRPPSPEELREMARELARKRNNP
ncbi:hypothetical protein VNO77_16547 [Canavalia gladiata]|uniref:Uncharacterized protein n=1 Tax=Canavalia gladiata TaxID=3824 RepID=A0AAN9M176_CANGL